MEVNPLQHSSVPAGYKQTEVGVIPEEWDVKSLEQISDPKRPICYGIVQVGQFANHGVNVLAIKNLNGDYTTNVHRCSPEIERPYVRSRVRPGDVLVSVKGTIGRVGLVPSHYVGNISRDLARIAPTDSDVPDFWYQLLQSELAQRRLEVTTVGTTRLELSIGPLKKVKVPRPTKPEQRAIAQALGDVDGLLAGLDRLIAKKRDLKQAAMQQLLTGQTRLPGFHGEWATKELGKLGKISGAGVDKKIRPGEPPVRLVNYMDVYRRSFIYSKGLDHVVSASVEQAARCAVKQGDIFFTPSSEMPYDIAMTAVAIEDIPDACYSYHIVRLRLDEDWDFKFRAYAFKTQSFLDQAARTCEGSGVRYVITQGKFRQLTVRYPTDKAEQTAIAEVLTDMDAELAGLEQRREKTRALKQAMMQELLTGKTRLV